MHFLKFTPKYVVFIGFLTSLCFFACKENNKNPIKKVEVSFTKEGELEIFHAASDSLLASIDIEIAETDYETQTGLMYRNTMDDKQGMLFIFPEAALHSFYMKNTQIPLDILFVDTNLKIASIHENAEPFNENAISSKETVQYVLEINAGLVAKWNISVGDSISLSR